MAKTSLANPSAIKIAFGLYGLSWKLAEPLLRLNPRLAKGFKQRTLEYPPAFPADLWIQAASVGEAYLAWEILNNLSLPHPINIFLTANTGQGLKILQKAVEDIKNKKIAISASCAFFPFDRPSLMKKAVRLVNPRLLILLESEIWPGLLAAMHGHNSKILIINGRMTARSYKRYTIWPSFWKTLNPDKILAISKQDAARFSSLFPGTQVDIMPNIKFDRIGQTREDTGGQTPLKNPLRKYFQENQPLVVLGSVRKEEETDILKLIDFLIKKQPDIIIGLFPRHMNRIKAWSQNLDHLSLPWQLRSALNQPVKNGQPAKNDQPVKRGSIVIWDLFGELSLAYGLANAAFVGGSLAPLGGQNFLEPLVCGVIPVIGESWYNFEWVGEEIIKQGLVRCAPNRQAVAQFLLQDLKAPFSHKSVQTKALAYLKKRQGGTATACRIIYEMLL